MRLLSGTLHIDALSKSGSKRARLIAINPRSKCVFDTPSASLRRQLQSNPQSAAIGGGERDVAAVLARDGAGDREAEADAAGVAVARAFEPVEGGERFLALVDRDAGAVVIDGDGAAERPIEPRGRAPAVFDGVVDEVEALGQALVGVGAREQVAQHIVIVGKVGNPVARTSLDPGQPTGLQAVALGRHGG